MWLAGVRDDIGAVHYVHECGFWKSYVTYDTISLQQLYPRRAHNSISGLGPVFIVAGIVCRIGSLALWSVASRMTSMRWPHFLID